MPEPTLQEIQEFSADPERGTGTPASIIDLSGMVRQLNDNARFKAENTWNKYNTFLNTQKEYYKQAQEIADKPVMDKDRPALMQQLSDALSQVATDPRSFFAGGGQKMNELNQAFAKVRSGATESALNAAFDKSNRDFIAQNPETNTDTNQKIVENYPGQPLGQREPYLLQMPYIFDENGFADKLMKHPSVMKTQFVPEIIKGENGRSYITKRQVTTYDKDAFMKLWNAFPHYGIDKYNRPALNYVQQQFDRIPENVKNSGIPDFKDAESFWQSKGLAHFGSDQNIVDSKGGGVYADPYDRYTQRLGGDLLKMKTKFGYDLDLLGHRLSNSESLALFKQSHGIGNNTKGGMWLNDQTASLIAEAKTNGQPRKYKEEGSDQFRPAWKANWNPEIMKIFSVSQTDPETEKTVKRLPDQVIVDADNNIHVNFFQKQDGKTIEGPDGHIPLDKQFSSVLTPDELKATLAKEYKLTNGLEYSNNFLLDNGMEPSLNGDRLDNYLSLRASQQPTQTQKQTTTTRSTITKKKVITGF